MQLTQSRIIQAAACLTAVSAALITPAHAVSQASTTGERKTIDLRSKTFSEEGINLSAMDDGREVMFNIYGGFAHQFRSNIDGGGDFSSSRIGALLGAKTRITPDFDVRLSVGYEFDHYRFSGDTGLGGHNPWDDIHTIGFGAIFGVDMSNDWRLFGGPIFQFSAESGGSFSDGFIGGGFIGTSFDISPELTLGGGVGVVSQIERGARVFPVVTIDWEITDQLKLTTETRAGASGDTAVELVYDWGGGFETAVGGTYRFRRFRLDDNQSGLAPEGVGQHSSFPFWVRLTYHFSPAFSLNVHGGAVFAGELRLMDSDGGGISKEDYDPAGLIGISGSIRF